MVFKNLMTRRMIRFPVFDPVTKILGSDQKAKVRWSFFSGYFVRETFYYFSFFLLFSTQIALKSMKEWAKHNFQQTILNFPINTLKWALSDPFRLQRSFWLCPQTSETIGNVVILFAALFAVLARYHPYITSAEWLGRWVNFFLNFCCRSTLLRAGFE